MMSAEWQKGRARTQMTLGSLIKALEAMAPGAIVYGLGDLMSYRGYYCDLAFEPIPLVSRPVAEVLAVCRNAMGAEFTGYKGGEFMMGSVTPIWIAEYGMCGDRLMELELSSDGKVARPRISPPGEDL